MTFQYIASHFDQISIKSCCYIIFILSLKFVNYLELCYIHYVILDVYYYWSIAIWYLLLSSKNVCMSKYFIISLRYIQLYTFHFGKFISSLKSCIFIKVKYPICFTYLILDLLLRFFFSFCENFYFFIY
jgi:hypothetical protein